MTNDGAVPTISRTEDKVVAKYSAQIGNITQNNKVAK
jgi:hypothetical protein